MHGPSEGKFTDYRGQDDETVWSASFFEMRSSLRTKVTHMRINHGFDENMISGFPKRFGHEYRFVGDDDSCTKTDRFEFGSRIGLIGRMFDELALRSKMDFLVQNRLNEIKTVAEFGRWKEFIS